MEGANDENTVYTSKAIIVDRIPEENAVTLSHIFKPSTIKMSAADLKKNECLVKVHYVSVDPTNRIWLVAKTYTEQIMPGDAMKAFGVGEIIASKHSKYFPGMLIQGILGWQEYIIVNAKTGKFNAIPVDSVFPSYYLDVLGVNGLTAYFGLKEVGQPKEGDTVVVSSAAGATGSIVCRLAKIWGCRVVGIAGGKEKCDFVKNELKADECIDYKKVDNLQKEIHRVCPKGINVYYDNVGEKTLDAALSNLSDGARVVLCGATSTYTNFKGERGLNHMNQIITKRAKVEGFVLYRFKKNFFDAVYQLMEYIDEGRLSGIETHFKGLEKAPEALDKLMKGENIGKLIIDISDGYQTPKL